MPFSMKRENPPSHDVPSVKAKREEVFQEED